MQHTETSWEGVWFFSWYFPSVVASLAIYSDGLSGLLLLSMMMMMMMMMMYYYDSSGNKGDDDDDVLLRLER